MVLLPLVTALAVLTARHEPSVRHPAGVVLVRGKVTRLETPKGVVRPAEVTIMHVYTGASDLKGRTFCDVYKPVSTIGSEARSPFVVGEEGIWSLYSDGKEELYPEGDPDLPFRYRSRVSEERHTQIARFAEMVEKFAATKPQDQAAALLGFLGDDTPEVSRWAVCRLIETDDPGSKKLRDAFALAPNLKLSLFAQIGMDEVLCKTTREEWFWAKPRLEMLRGWVSGNATEEQADRILKRLDAADAAEQIKSSTAIDLVKLAAGNKNWPAESRRGAIAAIGPMALRQVDHADAFDWLFEQMRSHTDGEVRRTAAGTLAQLPLYPKRLQTIEEHIVLEKDEIVAGRLREAIKRAKDKK